MVMLYRDPTGESVGTIPSTSSALSFGVTQSTTSNTDEKIMMLEKALMEKENKINELTYKVKALEVGGFNFDGYFTTAINFRIEELCCFFCAQSRAIPIR